jgi:signal transduction histidine kinase
METENQLLWPTFDEAGLVIALVNPAGEILRLSNAGANLLSVADAATEGRLYWEIFQKPEDWDSARSAFEVAKRKLGPSRVKAEWISPHQSPVALDWMMLSPAWDEKGELAHIVVTAALASEGSIASRRQMFRTIERIAGRIAGHFENLLSTINGYSELVLHDLSSASPLRKDVEQILAASERASETTRQLLGFSGRRLLSTERLELNSLLRKMGCATGFSLHSAPLTVLGTRKAFEEMLAVLTGYAGSLGTVPAFAAETAKLTAPRAALAEDLAPGDYVKLSVSLGRIAEEEVLQHVMEPFGSPLPGTRHSSVGLAMVNGITRSCGGGLSLSRSADEMVTLEIWLPAAAAAALAVENPAAKAEAKAAHASQSG